MQTKNSGIENLHHDLDKNINHGDVLLHGIILSFCHEGIMPSARRQSQSFGHMQFDANEKNSILKLTNNSMNHGNVCLADCLRIVLSD
jgi:hypothetical protein